MGIDPTGVTAQPKHDSDAKCYEGTGIDAPRSSPTAHVATQPMTCRRITRYGDPMTPQPA
jgi:hypothetical protein